MESPRSVQSQGDSPRAAKTADLKREQSIDSPKQQQQQLSESHSPRRNKTKKYRHTPYDRSPSSTSTSSDESTPELDNEDPEIKLQKRVAANCRERKRMHTVNSAFDQLRELVPTYPSNRKLSKIDTLRLACAYIQDLTSLVRNPAVMRGDDVNCKLYGPEGFLHSPPGCGSPPANGYGVQVKAETYGAEFAQCAAFQTYRPVQPFMGSDCASSDYSASESENASPPYFAPSCPAGIGVRPPPFGRTSSDGVANQMAHANISSAYPYSRSPVPSPLATVQHTSATLMSNGGVQLPGHISPPPLWQSSSIPSATYCVYGQ